MGRFDYIRKQLRSDERRSKHRDPEDWHVKVNDLLCEERRRMAAMFRDEIAALDRKVNELAHMLAVQLPSCVGCVELVCNDQETVNQILAYKRLEKEIVSAECDDCREK